MKREGKAANLAALKEILAPMTKKERLEYLWEYYKAVPIVAVVVIAFLASMISSWLKPEIVFEGIGVNVDMIEDDDSYITEDWLQVMGGNAKKETARYSSLYIGSFEADTVETELAVAAQKVMLMAIAESLDYVLMDRSAVDFYIEKGIFSPLEKVLSQEQLEQFQDKMIYVELEDNTKIPVALDISETSFAKQCSVVGKELFIAFPGNTERAELSDDFFDYLLAWNQAN